MHHLLDTHLGFVVACGVQIAGAQTIAPICEWMGSGSFLGRTTSLITASEAEIVGETVINHLMYADDTVIISDSVEQLESLITVVVTESEKGDFI